GGRVPGHPVVGADRDDHGRLARLGASGDLLGPPPEGAFPLDVLVVPLQADPGELPPRLPDPGILFCRAAERPHAFPPVHCGSAGPGSLLGATRRGRGFFHSPPPPPDPPRVGACFRSPSPDCEPLSRNPGSGPGAGREANGPADRLARQSQPASEAAAAATAPQPTSAPSRQATRATSGFCAPMTPARLRSV